MRLRLTLATLFLAACASAQAAGAADKACATAVGAAVPCPSAAMPIFILPAQGSAAGSAAPATTAQAPVAEEVPYVGLFQKSRLMKYLAWYCAVMAPIALILLTVFTLAEYRRRRAQPGAH